MAMRISDWYTPINYPVMPPREQKGIGDALLEIAKIQQDKRAERRQQEEMNLRKQEMEERKKSLELERQAREMEVAEKRRQQEMDAQLRDELNPPPVPMDEAFANTPASMPKSQELTIYDTLMKQGRVREAQEFQQKVLSQAGSVGGENTELGRRIANAMARSPNEELKAKPDVKIVPRGNGLADVTIINPDGTYDVKVMGEREAKVLQDGYGGADLYNFATGELKNIKAPVKVPGTGGGGGGGGRLTPDQIMSDKDRRFYGAQLNSMRSMRSRLAGNAAKMETDVMVSPEAKAQAKSDLDTVNRQIAALEGRLGLFPDEPAVEGEPAPGGAPDDGKVVEQGGVIDGRKYLKKKRTPPAGKEASAPTVSTVYAPDFMEKARQAAKKSGRSF